jgi:hypothetical protein
MLHFDHIPKGANVGNGIVIQTELLHFAHATQGTDVFYLVAVGPQQNQFIQVSKRADVFNLIIVPRLAKASLEGRRSPWRRKPR